MCCRAVSHKTDDAPLHLSHISIPLQISICNTTLFTSIRSTGFAHGCLNTSFTSLYTAPPFSIAHFFHPEDEARNVFRNSLNIYQTARRQSKKTVSIKLSFLCEINSNLWSWTVRQRGRRSTGRPALACCNSTATHCALTDVFGPFCFSQRLLSWKQLRDWFW